MVQQFGLRYFAELPLSEEHTQAWTLDDGQFLLVAYRRLYWSRGFARQEEQSVDLRRLILSDNTKVTTLKFLRPGIIAIGDERGCVILVDTETRTVIHSAVSQDAPFLKPVTAIDLVDDELIVAAGCHVSVGTVSIGAVPA